MSEIKLTSPSLEETTVGEILTPATIAQFVLVYEELGFDDKMTMDAFFELCFRVGVTTKHRNTLAQRASVATQAIGHQTRQFQEYLCAHPEILQDQNAIQKAMGQFGILPKSITKAA